MNTRERFHAIMDFKPFDRLPMIEWAMWWGTTVDRWVREGLPAATAADRYDLYRYFGMDVYYQDWVGSRCPPAPSHGAGVAHNPAEYDALCKAMYPKDPVNLELWEGWAKQQQSGQAVLWFSLDGFFWHPRTVLGIERHLYAFYDQPELMHRINENILQYNLSAIEQICSITTPDFMTFGEDMSYNHGPMLSKELFDEFIAPYYKRIVPELHKRGIKTIIDSDGDITVLTAWFRDVGVDGLLPLERQAGVDIAKMRQLYPTMRFIGHYDKMVMPHGEKAMRAEFERLLPVAAKGGFLPSVDHQTPPGVSYEQYKIFLKLFEEYAWKAGELSREQAHGS